ncbi:hypothetical protein ACA910_018672 [Epithemia clementina (nom. ined.)]
MNRLMQQARDMRINRPMGAYSCGPFPLADTLGLVPALMSLQQSLDRGRNSKTIQWDTMRGMRTTFSNFVHTTPAGTGGAILSDGKKSTRITNSSTNSLWFQRFMDGCHERMGDVWVPDAAITIDVLKALDNLWESLWMEATADANMMLRHEVASTACAVTCGFSAGLRGEELGHIRLRDSVMLTTQGLQHPRYPHIVLAMEGRFKGQVSRRKHKIPLVPNSASGPPNQKWFMRVCEGMEENQIEFGPMLRPTLGSDMPVKSNI